MSRIDAGDGPSDSTEAFDPVELLTESDDADATAARQESEKTAATPSDEVDTEDSEAGSSQSLLSRAMRAAGSDAARYVPVRFIPALTSLVTTPVFTRAIDKADYGAFYLVSAIVSLVTSIAVQWLMSSSIRFYWPTRKDGRTDSYLATVVWTGLASLSMFAVMTAIAVAVGAGSIQDVVLRLVPAALIYFIAHAYGQLLLQVLRAANRSTPFARYSIAVTLIVTVLSVGFVWFLDWGANGILWGTAIGNAVVMPFLFRSLRSEGSMALSHFDRPLLGEFLSYGLPLVPSGLAGWALVVLDRFVLSNYRGAAEVGLYSVAYGLGDKIMQLVTMPLLLTMMPSIIEAYERRGQDLAEKMQTHFTRYFAVLTFPLLAGLAAGSSVFMYVFTGPEYRDAYPVLAIVSAGSMLGAIAQVAGAGLGMHKKTKLIMIDVIAAAVFNVGLNVALVPRYGYMAAAWNTCASYALLLFLTWLQSRRYMAWRIPWLDLARVLGASLAMAAVLSAMTAYLAPGLPLLLAELVVGIAVYSVLLVAFGGIRRDERDFAIEMAGRAVKRIRKR